MTVRFWYSVPVLALLAAAGAAWVVLAPLGSSEQWRTAGAAAALGGGAGFAAAIALRRRPAWPLLAIVAVGLGWWRGATVLPEQAQPWTDVPNDRMRMIATIDAPVDTRGATAMITARIDGVDVPTDLPHPSGRIQLITPALPSVEMGNTIEVEGRFRPLDPHDPRERRLLANGIVATALFPQITMTGPLDERSPAPAIQRLRAAVEATVGRMLPEPHAALLVGLMIGSGGGMPDDFRSALIAAGLTHVVVASGYNVTLVAAALRSAVRLPRPFGALLPLAGVVVFTLLTGGAAPSMRAAIMAGVALLAGSTGRGGDALVALALASSAMVLHDPQLIVDLSFQLSALATLGLIALSPRVARLLGRLPSFVGAPLAATMAAQLATAPLLLMTFYQASIVAPVTNVLVAPLIPLATIGGGLGVAVVALVPPLAAIIGAILLVPTAPIVAIAETAATVPSALISVGAIPAAILVLYAVAVLAWAVVPTPEGQRLLGAVRSGRARSPTYAIGGALVALALVAAPSLAQPRPTLTISVLDVGDGDAVLVRTPGGQTVLIDGGPNPSALLSEVGRRLGPLERSLAIAILTGVDRARLAGAVAAAERYPVGLAVAPPERSPSALAERWNAAVQGRAIVAEEALVIDLEPGLRLELLPTPAVPLTQATPPLQRTLAVRIGYEQVSVLVAPSLTPEAARALLAAGASLRAEALVVPRHGEARSLDAASLAAMDPSVALIPVGPRNRSLPSPELLALLADIPILRTDRHGSIELRTDGTRLWLTAERAPDEVPVPAT
jgi:competence protein ComEC